MKPLLLLFACSALIAQVPTYGPQAPAKLSAEQVRQVMLNRAVVAEYYAYIFESWSDYDSGYYAGLAAASRTDAGLVNANLVPNGVLNLP